MVIPATELNFPESARAAIRANLWTQPTVSLAPGYAQANLVILPEEYAAEFRAFCQTNPKACPVIEELPVGSYTPQLAPLADLRTDVPRYRIFRHGEFTEEVSEIKELWQADFCAFLIGCSFTFDWALLAAGIPLRHHTQGCNVAMYCTRLAVTPVGAFKGQLVVSMRPLPAALVPKAVEVSSRYPQMHGSPVHIGDPAAIGIRDLSLPDYGDAVEVKTDEIPVFWACGVTPQAVALEARLPLMITHAPGHMFITDLRHDEILAQT